MMKRLLRARRDGDEVQGRKKSTRMEAGLARNVRLLILNWDVKPVQEGQA